MILVWSRGATPVSVSLGCLNYFQHRSSEKVLTNVHTRWGQGEGGCNLFAWRVQQRSLAITMFTGRFLGPKTVRPYPFGPCLSHSPCIYHPILTYNNSALQVCISACDALVYTSAAYSNTALDQIRILQYYIYASRDVCAVIQSCVACAVCSLNPPSSITPFFSPLNPACTCTNTIQLDDDDDKILTSLITLSALPEPPPLLFRPYLISQTIQYLSRVKRAIPCC